MCRLMRSSQELWVCAPRHLAAPEVLHVQMLARPAALLPADIPARVW